MRRIGDKAAFAGFILSILCFGAAYGYLVHHYQWFPHPQIVEARSAYRAWREVEGEGLKPATFGRFDDEPAKAFAGNSRSDDWILVTGGPYEFMEQCPTFGCLAWVMTRDGTVIHSWEADLPKVFGQIDNLVGRTDPASFMPMGVRLLDDGGLLVVFQAKRAFPAGAGLARFDRDGRLVWYNRANMHHWFTVGPDGTIYVPMHEAVETPLALGTSVHELVCPDGRILIDSVALVDPDGRMLDRINLLDLLLQNGYIGLVTNTSAPCNPLHLNFVEYIDSNLARAVDGAEEGDLLVSLRDINTVLIFSPKTGVIKWIETGRHVGQHSPRLLPDGSLLIFDNVGGDRATGKTRVIRLNTADEAFSVLWPRADATDEHLISNYAGHISISDDGARALVSITETGDVLELDLASGRVLWRYQTRFPAEKYPYPNPEGRPFVVTHLYGTYYVDSKKFASVFEHGDQR